MSGNATPGLYSRYDNMNNMNDRYTENDQSLFSRKTDRAGCARLGSLGVTVGLAFSANFRHPKDLLFVESFQASVYQKEMM